MIARIVTVVGVTLAVMLALVGSAQACSPAPNPPTPEQKLRSADVGIWGRVTAMSIIKKPYEQFEATVRVIRVFKGHPGGVVRIRGPVSGATCGFKPRVGQRIGLVLNRPSRPYAVSAFNVMSLADLRRAKWRLDQRAKRRK